MAAGPLLKVSVFSDYICPFCWVGSSRLRALEAEFDLRVNWCGLEIHPEVPESGMSLDALGYDLETRRGLDLALERLAAEDGLALRLPERLANSRRALLLSEAAKEEGREVFYGLHEALFRACFEAGRDIGDPALLESLAREAGLTRMRARQAWSEPRFAQRLALNRRFAAELGISGTPTYVFGSRLVRGAVSLGELRAAARALQSGLPA